MTTPVASLPFNVLDKDNNPVVARTLPLAANGGIGVEIQAGAALPLPVGAATEVTLAALLAELQRTTTAIKSQIDLANSVWTDTAGLFYILTQKINEGTGVLTSTIYDPVTSNVITTTPAGFKPYAGTTTVSGGGSTVSRAPLQKIFRATANGTGYVTGDYLGSVTIIDESGSSATLVAGAWINLTQHTLITTTPTNGTYIPEDQVVSPDVAAAMSATGTYQTNVSAVLGLLADTTAAAGDTGAYSLKALMMRGLQRWTTLLAQLPATLGQKLGVASFPVVIASDQSPVAMQVFLPIKQSTVALTAGPTATVAPVALAAQASGTVNSVRVRNAASSANPVTFKLSSTGEAAILPVAYNVSGGAGTVGDKTLDPGAVEVFALSASQIAALAAGTLTLSAITPDAGLAVISVTPGIGA